MGLEYLHKIGVTHTDIRAENILVEDSAAEESIKIIDFGGATWDSEYHSSLINTRQYRAPEIILQSQVWDAKSDLWGLGCLLVEMYTGNSLFISFRLSLFRHSRRPRAARHDQHSCLNTELYARPLSQKGLPLPSLP